MKVPIDIQIRKPIWIALSNFYLDTELDETDFKSIASAIIASPYSLDEVKAINKYEVFPLLQANLLSVAGEWDVFDEEWLVKGITDSLARRNIVRRTGVDFFYFFFKWMCKDYWVGVDKIYGELKG